MFDKEIVASQVKADRFPFPSEGGITLAVRNSNYSLGPVMLHLVMSPGSVIPAHLHQGVAEVLYVIEGDLLTRASNTCQARRFTSRPVSSMARTAVKRAASFSCFGRIELRQKKPTSTISPCPRLLPEVCRIYHFGQFR
jgi:Cupin